jgi:hypothetical protein
MSEHAVRSCSCRPILDSSAAGAAVYRSLGFEEIGQLEFWVMT